MKSKKEIQNVELAFNCPQDWESMTVCGNGRFCNGCQKIVYDFTDKSQKDYEAMLRQHDGQICGRFQQKQMKPSASFAKAAAFAALSFGVTEGVAQTPQPPVLEERAKLIDNKDSTNYFFGVICEPNPEFIGGTKAMFEFLREYICYPDGARNESIMGTVYVGFYVETDGRLTEVKVKRGICSDLDNEAIYVVKSMSGKWKPGKQGGKFTRVAYTIPIKFTLD